MAIVHAIPEPAIDDDIFEEADSFEKEGNWTEDRKEILKNLTGAEIDAGIMRLQEEYAETLLSPEEIQEKALQAQKAKPAKRRVEMVGA